MTVRRSKVPVSKAALVARINRKLKPDWEMVRATRGERWRPELGDWYAVDLRRNAILATHLDLEEYGRDLGVLREFEAFAE
jgi:hypothetical protein